MIRQNIFHKIAGYKILTMELESFYGNLNKMHKNWNAQKQNDILEI